jgi:hypothetical protein
MKLAGVLCVPLGHRWHPIESDTTFPVLKCARCDRVRELTAESRGPEGWMTRGARAGTMRQMMDDPTRRR